MQARWSVPRVEAGTPPAAVASTWIGAQASGAPGAFIQLGTSEASYALPGPAQPNHSYVAFWSDLRRAFHPQPLFAVNAGDEITASLALSRGRWELTIADSTSGRSARFSTSQDAHASFDEAEWLQEDVRDARTGAPFPYPT